MENHLPILLEYVTRQRWAMDFGVLQQMLEIFNRHYRSERLDDEEIRKITAVKNDKGSDKRSFEVTRSGMAIIPVSGIIAKYARMVNGSSQPRGTSIETLSAQLDEAMADSRVGSIFLHIESPGGYIDGLPDFADQVYQAGFEKPVVAFADDLAASAAYWIGSQANAFYANQSALVGSIGVYTIVVDSSAHAESFGFKFHIIRSGPNKGVGATGIEITDENLKVLSDGITADYEMFLSAILRARSAAGLDEGSLRVLADGRLFNANAAKKNKLIDKIMTLQQALESPLPVIRGDDLELTQAAAQLRAEKLEEIQIQIQNGKEKSMSEKDKTSGPAAGTEQLQAEATATERKRITAVTAALAGDEFAEIREKAIAEGLNVTEAKALAFDTAKKLGAENVKSVQAQLNEANKKLAAIVGGGTDVTAPETIDASEASGQAIIDDGKAETYKAAVAKFQTGGLSKAKAYARAATKFPKSHEAWKKIQPVSE